MIIKKWSGSAWVEQFPKTTVSNLYLDDGTSQFLDGGKIRESLLPNSVFDSLYFFTATGSNANLSTLANNAKTDADGLTPARSFLGYYWVALTSITLTANTSATLVGSHYYTTSFLPSDESATGATTTVLETGDWIVVSKITGSGTSGDPYSVRFAVVDNTYEDATSTVKGIVKLGSDTTQSTAANTVSDTAGRSYAIQENATGQLVVNVPWTDTVYTLPEADTSTLGGVKLGSDTVQSVAANAVSATSSRSYAIQENSSGQLVVNVPWTDTDTNTTYSAGTGLTLTGTTFAANLIDMTARSVTAETITTTASRTYAVMPDADGDLVVNVPWVDTNTTYSEATNSTLGLVKVGYAENGKNYPVELSSGQMFVNVPWVDTNTTYSVATSTSLGLVELGSDTVQTVAANAVSATASRSYAIQLNSNQQMVVNVPWVDTNTTYSAGNGIALTGTSFSVAGGEGLTQEASGLKMTYPIYHGDTLPTSGVSTDAIGLEW